MKKIKTKEKKKFLSNKKYTIKKKFQKNFFLNIYLTKLKINTLKKIK